MKLDLRIERLVLEGVPLTRRDRELLGEGIRRELAHLLSEPTGSAAPPAGDALASRIASAVRAALPPDIGHRPTGAASSTGQPGRRQV
ncbi:MAG TPA: hypothetical protein VGL88_07565 [Pseudonocardiaceae bacterium]|jgi:hypothetical protein